MTACLWLSLLMFFQCQICKVLLALHFFFGCSFSIIFAKFCWLYMFCVCLCFLIQSDQHRRLNLWVDMHFWYRIKKQFLILLLLLWKDCQRFLYSHSRKMSLSIVFINVYYLLLYELVTSASRELQTTQDYRYNNLS